MSIGRVWHGLINYKNYLIVIGGSNNYK